MMSQDQKKNRTNPGNFISLQFVSGGRISQRELSFAVIPRITFEMIQAIPVAFRCCQIQDFRLTFPTEARV